MFFLKTSRPVRARGLKPSQPAFLVNWCKSRPVRARGLKRGYRVSRGGIRLVAPRAGAWIETQHALGRNAYRYRRAPCGRVD